MPITCVLWWSTACVCVCLLSVEMGGRVWAIKAPRTRSMCRPRMSPSVCSCPPSKNSIFWSGFSRQIQPQKIRVTCVTPYGVNPSLTFLTRSPKKVMPVAVKMLTLHRTSEQIDWDSEASVIAGAADLSSGFIGLWTFFSSLPLRCWSFG